MIEEDREIMQFSDLSDEALVRSCQEHLPYDTRSFEALVARHKQKVYGLAYRMMRTQQDAEDVAQETWVKVYHALPNFRGEASFKTWVHRIAVNTALDALQKQKRRVKEACATAEVDGEGRDLFALTDHSAGGNPVQNALSQELILCIEDAVRQLPDKEMSTIMLREFQGLSYQEIAEALRVSLGTVKMRLHRARKSLRQLIAQLCDALLPPVWRQKKQEHEL